MVRIVPGTVRRVAIIGAGPSGLVAAKSLLAEDFFSEIVIYEQRKTVGGIWDYRPLDPGSRKKNNRLASNAMEVVTTSLPRLNTPMYENLEANLPHMVMQFSDKPFPNGTQLFPTRETVMQYLEEYADEILPLTRLEHEVLDVKPTECDGIHKWELVVRNNVKHKEITKIFDAVIVANGHCDWPLLPSIEGLEAWSRISPASLYHSTSYRNTKPFEDKRILLVGSGPSAVDISHQIVRVCKHPLLIAQAEVSPYHTDLPNTREYPALVSLKPDERAAEFEDGSTENNIDAILLCTGYAYRYPFLTAVEPTIKKEGIRALQLYHNMFHMQYPTLAFVGTTERTAPFPYSECQAAVIARVWSDRLLLPSELEMHDWTNRVVHERGTGRRFHQLNPPYDLRHMKEMYEWVLTAAELQSDGKRVKGKMPKVWDDRACWERLAAAKMKKAFNARGKERLQVLTYEELGFHFDGLAKG